MSRPQDRTLKNVINYLNEIGLSVYGQNTNLETGQQFPALRDYDAEQVIKFRKLKESKKLWYAKEDY